MLGPWSGQGRAEDSVTVLEAVRAIVGDPVPIEQADVIVLGSHDRGRLGRLMLGSISARVAADARCGVLVVPREGPAAGD